MSVESKLKINAVERRASVALASLFACRMLGLFLLLPVFAVAALGLVGGDDPARVGLAGLVSLKRGRAFTLDASPSQTIGDAAPVADADGDAFALRYASIPMQLRRLSRRNAACERPFSVNSGFNDPVP